MRIKKGGVSSLPPPELASRARRLPPTLHIKTHTTTTGCSKAPRGLRLRLERTGLCASKSISSGSGRGQQGSRWAVRASRQLSDKVLRYLKRVIVTPAV